MRILILTPPGLTSDGQQVFFYPSRWSAATGLLKTVTYYPYELAYLSSMLKARCPQHEVRMADPSHHGVDEDEYAELLLEAQPDLLIVESDFLMHAHLMAAVRKARARGASFAFVLCGPVGTARPEACLEEGADHVAMGEFEEAVCRLVEGGLVTPSPGIFPDTRRLPVDVADLPLPEDADIRRRDYCRTYPLEHRAVHLYASRGCPHACDFCVAAHLYYGRPQLRCRPVDSVLDEIEHLLATIPDLEGVMFDEESHTANRAWTEALCHGLIRRGLHAHRYACMTNFSALDEDLLRLMREAGYYKVLLGVESLAAENTRTFLKSGQKSDGSRLAGVLAACRRLGIQVYGTFTLGSHGSSMESDSETIRRLEGLYEEGLIHEFQVSVNMPMPGTPFHALCEAEGWLHTWQGGLFPEPITMASYPGYTARQIMYVYYYAFGLQQTCIELNRRKGVRYANDDGEGWCRPVFDLKKRVRGTGVLTPFGTARPWDARRREAPSQDVP